MDLEFLIDLKRKLKLMKIEKIDNKNNTKEHLPQIVERIFAICKNDQHFHLSKEMEIAENKIDLLTQKNHRHNNLLKQSKLLKNDLKQRLETIENQNEKKKIELLELLGSYL